MMKKITTSFLALAIAFSTPVEAQTNEVSRLNNRIAQLETQIQTLSRAVFRGDVDASAFAAPPAGAGGSSAVVAQMDVKISQLETQLRQLTGQMEEQRYEISNLTRQIEEMSRNGLGAQAQPMANGNSGTFTNPNANLDSGATADSPGAPTALTGGNDGVFSTPSALQNPNAAANGQGTLNTGASTAVSAELAGNPDQLYEKAFVDIRDGNYDAAASGFQTFLTNYPDHTLTSNAQYWLAETYYVRANYTEAAKLFAKGYQEFPESSKTADNLLKLGLSLSKLGKNDDACLSFQQLKTQFPDESGPVMRRADQELKNLNCG